jgi:hypothetical protein
LEDRLPYGRLVVGTTDEEGTVFDDEYEDDDDFDD